MGYKMKKRQFLAPLAISFAALLTTATASASMPRIQPITEPASVSSQAANAADVQESDFVLRHGRGVTLVDDDSPNHSSHASHQSHSSHSSHVSGGY